MDSSNIDHSSWHLIYTKPNQEEVAKINLEKQGVKVFLPKIFRDNIIEGKNQKSIIEPLFSRYLFVKMKHDNSNYSFIRSTRGVSNFIIFGDLKTSCVPNKIIKEIKHFLDENDTFKEKIIRRDFESGDKLTIKKGSAKGLEAIFLHKSGKNRVKILINFINNSLSIDLPKEHIGKKKEIESIKL